MRKQHHITIRIPIPLDVPPELVVGAIQSYTPTLRHHPLITKYEKRDLDAAGEALLREDPTFSADPPAHGLAFFNIWEDVVVVPGLITKPVAFPAVYRHVDNGMRFRAHASGGVVVWGNMTVARRGGTGSNEVADPKSEQADARGEGLLAAQGGTEWELVNKVSAEASIFLLPLVKWSMTKSNTALSQKVVDEVVEARRGSGSPSKP